jgi:hypothetical protein
MQVIDGATARESFKARISPWEQAELRHTQNAYVQMGLVPAGTDLLTGFLDLAEKDVAGYYEHGSKTFYLLDHVAAAEVRGVIAHELTHALEDQHHDLGAIARKASGDGDHSIAISAVVEGSATVVQLAFLSREVGEKEASAAVEQSGARRAERLRIAPSYTQRSLMLPYILGFSFLLRGKPWQWTDGGVVIADIERAYRNPPSSTRQILHPEQYWMREPGAHAERLWMPDLSPVLGAGWSRAAEGSIGELGLAVLAGSRRPIEFPWMLLPSRWTSDAAIGTLGDVYHHYVNGERGGTVLLTRWETPRDNEEFDRAVARKGRRVFRYGLNLVVFTGDLAEADEALAIKAFQDARFYLTH